MAKYTKAQQKKNREKWIKALRSGKYKQTREQLKSSRTGGMCCLGVACEVSKLGNWGRDEYGQSVYRVGNAEEFSSLPMEVTQFFGLATPDGSYKGNSLIDLNDNEKRSFKTIAKVIESEPEGLLED